MGPAYHFDKLAKSGQVVTCYQGNSSTVRWINTVDKATDTNQWTYTTPTIGTVPSSVTGAHTISASDSRTENKYNVTFTNGTYGTWDSTTAINATYSTSISKSGMVVTVGSTSRTYSLPSNTAQYTYTTTINNASGTVGTGKSITTTDVRTTNKYAVSITKGTGISSVYLSSTSDTATSGDNSGTQYNYGTKVRAYAVLADHYDVPADSTWTLVSGTANATGAKYKIGEVTVSGAHNFGTINAAIETYTLSVTKGTGIARIYYKVNGASNYSSTTSNLSVSVNDQSTYYYYAVADDYHTVNSDCGTSSSPKSGTVNCANVSKSVSTTAKTYPLRYEYDHGSVTWYSDANRTNTITGAAYGTTIYYSKTPSTGYINSGAATGSVVLNTSNFEIVEYSGTMTAVMDFGSATRISGTISQGTLPTGVASITCYRKA